MFSWKQHRNSASNGPFQSCYFLKRRFAALQIDAGAVHLVKRRVPDSKLVPCFVLRVRGDTFRFRKRGSLLKIDWKTMRRK